MTTNIPIFSVSEISSALKKALEEKFGYVRVRGELSGVKRHSSGHCYWDLKDGTSLLNAVCWRGTRLAFEPENGMEVICTGRITNYAARSNYQMVVESMELAGEGALLKLLEERKKRLAAEGLFDAARKKPLPFLPGTIGVITSPTGAVIRDILHRIQDRFPCRVLVWPVAVQGEGAAEQITAAIRGFNAAADNFKPDVIIVARGGGSIEDLMAFNDEAVVRAVADSFIPLVSAVGHETDTNLIDFAADLRAPTPTAAAEMVVPVREDLITLVETHSIRARQVLRRIIENTGLKLSNLASNLTRFPRQIDYYGQRLDELATRIQNAPRQSFRAHYLQWQTLAGRLRFPMYKVDQSKDKIQSLSQNLQRAVYQAVRTASQDLSRQAVLLESYSYHNVLQRGFALVTDMAGKPVRSIKNLIIGNEITIKLQDGEAGAVIKGK